MNDYSQNGEQSLVQKYFGADYIGTALSLGENDGRTFSNVYGLHLAGWSTVLVEPSPVAFAKLNRLHANSDPLITCLVNAAIADEDKELEFWDSGTHLKKGDAALLSTAKPSEIDRWKKSGEVFTKTKVRGITFKTLLEECQRDQFDFISIDCEGMDLEVLRQIDLKDTRMVCVEWNGKNKQAFIEACPGFRLVHENGENLIFAR